jgi:mannose-6-phosphate isomerase-like protein (cupin superfamily)
MSATPVVVDSASAPRQRGEAGLVERPVLGPYCGVTFFEQSLLECPPGGSATRSTEGVEEVLFVLSGHGTLRLDGEAHTLEPEAGAYVAPGREYALEANEGETLEVVSVRVPDPVAPNDAHSSSSVVRRLADQAAGEATTERWFRIIADPSSGLQSATHFVGYIPTAKAPEHFHTYDEVIYVLDGEGAFHAGGESLPLRAGRCIALPARTVHCLENTGTDTMRVMAIFRPAGSPAAAYYPDGTPAYEGLAPVAGVN